MAGDAEKQDLHYTIELLTEKLTTMEFAENEELKSELRATKSLVANFELQLSSALDEIVKKTSEIDRLKSDLMNVSEATTNVCTKLSGFEATKEQLEGQLEELSRELTDMKSINDGLRHEKDIHLVQIEKLEVDVSNMVAKDRLTLEVTEAVKEAKEEWEKVKCALQDNLESITNDLGACKETLTQTATELEEHKLRAFEAEGLLHNAEQSKGEIEQKMLSLIEIHSASMARLQTQKSEMEVEIKALREDLEDTKKNFKLAKNAWDEKNQDISATKKEASELRDINERIKQDRERIKEIHGTQSI